MMFCRVPFGILGARLRAAGLGLSLRVLRAHSPTPFRDPPAIGRLTKLTSSYIVASGATDIYRAGPANDKCRRSRRRQAGRGRMADGSEWMQSSAGIGNRSAVERSWPGIAGWMETGAAGRSWSACSAAASSRRARPIMHEREGARLGMRYTYALIDFDRLDLADAALGEVIAAGGAAGLCRRSTSPIRSSRASLPISTDLSPEAAAIGAVNTVVFEHGRRIGHNTDCWGFAESFRERMGGMPPRQRGAVRRRRRRCARSPTRCWTWASANWRSSTPTAARAGTAGAKSWPPGSASVITPVHGVAAGARPTPPASSTRRRSAWRSIPALPFPADLLTSRHWVAEIVYFPQETELLRLARGAGLPHAGRHGHGGLPGRARRSSCSPASRRTGRRWRAISGRRHDPPGRHKVCADATSQQKHPSIDMNEPFRTVDRHGKIGAYGRIRA